VQQLDRDTRPPSDAPTGETLVDWATRLRRAYVRDNPTWPESERSASEALDLALESLRQAAALEATTTLGAFDDALASALEARRLNEGRAGVGVLVAPMGASTGAAASRGRPGCPT